MISGVLAVVVWFATLIVGGLFGIWVGWGLGADHEAEEQYRLERHTHRLGDPAPGVLIELPRAGRLPLERLTDPAPLPGEWLFAGGWDQGPVADTAEQPEAVPGVDTPSDYTRGMTERVNAMIAEWAAQGNYDRHTIQAGD